MRRGKIVIRKIEEKLKRQVTFAKRKKSLLKKAHELSVLCDVHIGLIIFSQSHKLYNFCSHHTSMENLIMRYQMATEGHTSAADHGFHPDHGSNCAEMKESMMREINNLKMNLELYAGHGLNLLTYDDLLRFELQLESSLQHARARKFEFMQQQMNKLKGKEKLIDEDNQYFYHPFGQGSSWEQLMWQSERQMMMMCQREGDDDVMRQQVKKEFPFYGEEHPTDLLHPLQLQRGPSPSPCIGLNPGPSS